MRPPQQPRPVPPLEPLAQQPVAADRVRAVRLQAAAVDQVLRAVLAVDQILRAVQVVIVKVEITKRSKVFNLKAKALKSKVMRAVTN